MAISRKSILAYTSIALFILFYYSSLLFLQSYGSITDESKISLFVENSFLSASKDKNGTSLDSTLLESKRNQSTIFLDLKSPLPQQLPLTVVDYTETPFYTPLSLGYSSKHLKTFYYSPYNKECVPRNHLNLTEDEHYQVICPNTLVEGIENSYLYPEELGAALFKPELVKLNNRQKLNKTSEYHLVKCGENLYDVAIRNVRNDLEAEVSLSLTKKLLNHYKKPSFRPLTVVFCMVDSASRQMIYRNLQDTFEYLNSYLSKSEYIMYDFKLNNAIKSFTFPNLIPMIYGLSHEKFMGLMAKHQDDLQSFRELLNNRSIITQFKKMGFITLVSTDSVNEGIDQVLGKKLNSTHTVNNFFKIAQKYFHWDESVDGQACIGSNRPTHYSLKYLLDYIKNYKKLNKFAFVQTNIAHENTGTRLKTADRDFRKFFRDLFRTFDHENEDLVFMLVGDHGHARGDYTTIESLSERTMASHFILSNKKFIKELSLNEMLLRNSGRLLSRYDWYKTLMMLSYLPFGVLEKDSSEYLKISTDYDSINVLFEEASILRTCESIGVSPGFCLSRDLTILNLTEKRDNPTEFLLEHARDLVNKQLSLRPLCGSIKLENATALTMDIDGSAIYKSTNYWVRVNIKGSDEVLLIHGILAASFFCNEKPDGLFSHFQVLMPENVCVRLEGITRLFPIISKSDIYAHKTCAGIIKFDNSLYLNDKKQSCAKFCEGMSMECNRPQLYHFVLGEIKRNFQHFEVVGKMDSIEVVDGKIEVGRGRFCENIPENDEICYCSFQGNDAWDGVLNDSFN